MRNDQAALEVTEDAVLGGRLRLRQPRRGHRFGHDAILLAAATGGRYAEQAADLGAGVGAAGLALACRVPGLKITLAEIDPVLCALAKANARLNAFDERVRVVTADVTSPALFALDGLEPGTFERVLMNPPFNDPVRQNVSPDPGRRLAHAAPREALAHWLGAAARLLKPRGVLTMIWRADGLAGLLNALSRDFGSVAVLPVHPRPATPAIRVLLRAEKEANSPFALLPALMLNDAAGRPTTDAEAVLRHGAGLPLAAI